MKRFSSCLFTALFLMGLAGTSQGQAFFTSRLTGAQETPSAATPALGTGCFTLTSAGLQFYITAEGLAGPIITAAEFGNAPPGMPGPVVRDIISEFAGTNSAAGLWAPTDAQPLTATLIPELLAGNIYVNIHTPPFVPGEIRGQVQLSDGVHLTANLQGTQVNPPVFVPGTGVGSFTLTEEGLHFKITLNGLVGGPITDVHIHIGAIGVNGPIMFPITALFVGNSATGFLPLTPFQRKSLLAGDMYVDVHTVGFVPGELRGQINLAGGFGFSIKLDGGQEIPANAVPGLGNASATLTPSGLVLDLTATGLIGGGPIIGAHLHNAPAGALGPPVRDILPDFIAPTNTAQVLWRRDDPGQPMTPALAGELLQNRIYVNLETPAFATGEIRGQLVLNTPGPTPEATYTANLTPMQEEPPVGAPSLGTATFQLAPFGLVFNATFDGLTSPLAGVEFYNAAIGVNGGVVRTIGGAEFIGPNTIAGLWSPGDPMPFTPTMMTELFKGNIYLNVRTALHVGGELRGQLLPGSGAEFEARLIGFQEVPPTPVGGLATSSFTLTPHGLAFNVTSDGLTGAIAAANIRLGDRGIAGPIVRSFVGGEFITGNTLAGVWKPTDPMPLTPALVTELLKGNLYVNLQTGAFPAGEIRGQITLSGGDPHGARPVGMQEVPPVLTPGKGIESGTLTDEGYQFRMSSNDMFGAPFARRIENAPVGVIGPVVRPFYPPELISPETVDGVWKTTDADPLTTALLGEMLNENLYINILTPPWATGEIRGQIGSPRATVGVQEPMVGGGAELQLSNAPNPVHDGGTNISFFLPKRSDVYLAIYDVAGAQVTRLAQGSRDAGWHHMAFGAKGLSSGIYFYRLDAANLSMSRKLLVLR